MYCHVMCSHMLVDTQGLQSCCLLLRYLAGPLFAGEVPRSEVHRVGYCSWLRTLLFTSLCWLRWFHINTEVTFAVLLSAGLVAAKIVTM